MDGHLKVMDIHGRVGMFRNGEGVPAKFGALLVHFNLQMR
jgi:hypothetical protein